MFSHRLKELINYLGVSITAFETKIGVSKGAIAKPIKNGKTVGVEVLEKILIEYPNVNLDWLVAGIGKMLKLTGKDEIASVEFVTITKDEYINLQRKALQNQDERIAALEREVKGSGEK
nr:helix-turn-helix transcriptional regulator [uncultured Dyadobacter sp.]